MAYIYNMADTWADAGTTFTAIKMNVTDTASNAASLLMDLQTGGASRFSVRKDGAVQFRASGAVEVYALARAGNALTFYNPSNLAFFDAQLAGVTIRENAAYSFSPTSDASAGADLRLFRDAANTLAQRNSTNAQAFRVYGTFTDASNYLRGFIRYNSNILEIGSEAAGTGTASAVRFFSGVSNSTFNWAFSSGGHFVAGTDNAYDIGSSGASRPRRFFLGGGSLTGTEADSSLTISPTWNTTGTPIGVLLNVTDTASNASSLLMDLQVGGASAFRVGKNGSAVANVGLTLNVAVADTNRLSIINASGVAIRQNAVFGWGGATDAGGAATLALAYDAADTLAQRRTTNAQTFRIYNTFTDASNYERGFMRWSSNELQIGTENAGTGAARDLKLVPAMVNNGNIAGQRLQLGSNTTLYEQFGYLNFLSGGNGVNILQNLLVGGNIEQTAGRYFQMGEGTAPAAPAANNVRIYAEDNGSGKTRLMARFATGAAVQIAIEP